MSQLNVNIIKNRVGSNGPTISGNTNVSGILTATSFSGDGSGLTSLIISGDGNLTNLNVSGVSTFTGNTEFDGNVTIGGTLTYRDVTNIDAVGMITARKGVQILADGFTVTGVSTLSNGAFIPDSQYLNIGNDSDLRLYHTGTASFIEDQGTGNFIIGSNGGVLKITKGADTEDMAVFTPDGSAALYYDNAKKLETSTTGVTVTGDVTATSFSGDLTGTASNASGATGDFSIADKIVHTGDTNTAIRFPAADTFSVDTAGSERLQIDSSGVVKLTQSGSNPRYGSFEASSDAFKLKAFSGNASHNATMQFFTGADSPTERMRIDSSGKVIVSSTTLTNHNSSQFLAVGDGITAPMTTLAPTTLSYTNIFFRNPNGNVGSITTNGTATSYSTSSDYRLKENVVDIADGITRVKQLQPKRFNFITDNTTTVDGFIAHEAQVVVPEAVIGTKDATKEEEYEVTPAVLNDDGEQITPAVMGTRTVPDHQGIDQSKFVPLLTAALQEAIAKIETLETQNASLEARLTALEGGAE